MAVPGHAQGPTWSRPTPRARLHPLAEAAHTAYTTRYKLTPNLQTCNRASERSEPPRAAPRATATSPRAPAIARTPGGAPVPPSPPVARPMPPAMAYRARSAWDTGTGQGWMGWEWGYRRVQAGVAHRWNTLPPIGMTCDGNRGRGSLPPTSGRRPMRLPGCSESERAGSRTDKHVQSWAGVGMAREAGAHLLPLIDHVEEVLSACEAARSSTLAPPVAACRALSSNAKKWVPR